VPFSFKAPAGQDRLNHMVIDAWNPAAEATAMFPTRWETGSHALVIKR